MRVSSTTSIDITKSTEVVQSNGLKQSEMNIPSSMQSDQGFESTDKNALTTKQACQVAVIKLNEFMEYHNKNSKFVYHEKLEKYYVEIVDAETQKVIKEIPPKELLDAYYEMQKMIGKVIDKTV